MKNTSEDSSCLALRWVLGPFFSERWEENHELGLSCSMCRMAHHNAPGTYRRRHRHWSTCTGEHAGLPRLRLMSLMCYRSAKPATLCWWFFHSCEKLRHFSRRWPIWCCEPCILKPGVHVSHIAARCSRCSLLQASRLCAHWRHWRSRKQLNFLDDIVKVEEVKFSTNTFIL